MNGRHQPGPSAGLPRLGVLHRPGAAAGLPDLLLAARDRCRLIIVLRDGIARANPALVALAGRLAELAVVPDGPEPLGLDGLGLAGLATFADPEVDGLDAALTRLGLPGAPDWPRRWDKLHQRRRFVAAGLSTVRAEPVDSRAGLAAAIAAVGLPAVLKPRRGAASVGVSFLTGDVDVRSELATREDWTNLVLEEMIPHVPLPAGCAAWLADFVSVDTVTSADGVHRHVAVVGKLPHSVAPRSSRVAIRETGNVMPSGLPADRLDAVLAATTRALEALAVRGRISHTELRVGPSTVEPIEVNGRMGGFTSDMLRRMGGPDLVAAAFDVALGGPPPPERRLRPGILASVWIPFAERSGTVLSAASRPRLRAVPGVERVDLLARRGDPRADTGFHAARVTVWATDQGELDRVVAGVLDEVGAMFAADRVGEVPWFVDTRRLLPAPVTTARRAP